VGSFAVTRRFDSLVDTFLQQGTYLRNWSSRTVRTYRQGLASLIAALPDEPLTQAALHAWVVALRQRGLTPGGVNMYARTVNSWLSWLHAEHHLASPLRLRLLRAPLRQIRVLSDAEIRLLVLHRPRTRVFRRAHTLTLTLLDTGVRIAEALSLEWARVDFDQCVLTVYGKGGKERVVPFSTELRKVLWRWHTVKRTRPSPLVFATYGGSPLIYRNVHRELVTFARAVGVRSRVHPHLYRHQFAANYIRKGGDIYRLSRLLGHTHINTTALYLRSLGIADIRAQHERLTPLRSGY
jgi:integrase/recombinase XerD